MMPPLVRRCPECGHVGWSGEFDDVDRGTGGLVECPSCRHRFETVDRPWLN